MGSTVASSRSHLASWCSASSLWSKCYDLQGHGNPRSRHVAVQLLCPSLAVLLSCKRSVAVSVTLLLRVTSQKYHWQQAYIVFYNRSPRWPSRYPRKPCKFQVMGSIPGESVFFSFICSWINLEAISSDFVTNKALVLRLHCLTRVGVLNPLAIKRTI